MSNERKLVKGKLKVQRYRDTYQLIDEAQTHIAHFEAWGNSKEIAERMAACWNACLGYNPEMLRQAMKWIEKNQPSLRNYLDGMEGPYSDSKREVAEMVSKARAGIL